MQTQVNASLREANEKLTSDLTSATEELSVLRTQVEGLAIENQGLNTTNLEHTAVNNDLRVQLESMTQSCDNERDAKTNA